jgi:hypothetical protein
MELCPTCSQYYDIYIHPVLQMEGHGERNIATSVKVRPIYTREYVTPCAGNPTEKNVTCKYA